MPTPAPSTTEADVILNKTALALAKSQRLIASWLPPPTASDLAHTKTEAQIEKEENEMFTPVPELLGLGAPVPTIIADGDRRRSELSSNERLRRQLLGRDMAKLLGRKGGVVGQDGLVKARPLPVVKKRGAGGDEGEEEEEEEEVGGRSEVGRAKRRVGVVVGGMGGDGVGRDGGAGEEGGGDGSGKALGDGKAGSLGRERGRIAGGSYLDQVLAEKSLKKRKKKRRKEGAGVGLS